MTSYMHHTVLLTLLKRPKLMSMSKGSYDVEHDEGRRTSRAPRARDSPHNTTDDATRAYLRTRQKTSRFEFAGAEDAPPRPINTSKPVGNIRGARNNGQDTTNSSACEHANEWSLLSRLDEDFPDVRRILPRFLRGVR